ncbi:hypothetical protein CRI94_09895 [Longibacter salinarum]|uniref:STAS domain-containing protein n=1 Tax=Longibacter salinarum TaxID=1850348 RepID=A0A2A8CYA3_9BACT|nr:STAS domain-containing protein [Longibacter salinarum]PEN13610.1 hypothetical protein CRI94_09895 [Longibacter salinarum]
MIESTEHVIVDLRDVRFADTEGIAHLHRLQLQGTPITVRNPPDLFFEILRVLELDGLFEIHTDATV